MTFSREGFKHFKNILHPNVVENANHYLTNGYYRFPPYHGCGKKIEMEQISQLIINAVNNVYSLLKKDIGNLSKNKISRNVKFTRYMTNLGINFYAKTKKRMWYDYNKKCYRPRADWYKNIDPFFEYNI